ncbi:hypothetical protein [Fodinibius sp.]|uniref:hypothetical protein n=1 Tax=Fodinibius sp. TaxID=1872440 RepID=UPI002ACDFBD1|nr:hypothetical protein [Fodinibius sp.]MDZ7660054.1 hypothetical protein [Fodinibius sp.]
MKKSNLTEEWEIYFDELGISFLSEEEVTIANGETYRPTFYLPEYQCFAQVNDGPFDKSDFENIRHLVKDTNIPLVLLNKDPKLSSYQMIVADENGPNGIRFEDINLCNHPHRPEKDEFVKNVFLENEEMFKEVGLNSVISAVKKAKGTSEESSPLEKQWMIYFDELNIDNQPRKRVNLKDGTQHTFSFYLPELECLVEVVGPPITNSHYNKLLQAVVETETPVVFIEGSPNFRFYEMIIPQGGEDYDVKAINIIQEGKKFVELEVPMDTKGEFKSEGFSEAITAIEKSQYLT